jgi:two-component system chemotaxis sensor kinase CheA
MSLDLTQFHTTFFEESFEALDSMETALLKLSVGEVDAELINTIFRVAHSIKGGSATFGFSDIAGFTHTLETLLDQLRGGKRQARPAIVDVLLRSVDVMRAMLTATQQKQPHDAARVGALHAELQSIMESSDAEPQVPVAGRDEPAAAPVPAAGCRGWRIRLVPGPEMLRCGNDPVRMLRELRGLGAVGVSVQAARLPPLADLDPEVCLLSWNVELDADVGQEAVRQVFEWAEGECELEITPKVPAADSASGAQAAAAAPADVPSRPGEPAAAEAGKVPAHPAGGAGEGGSIRVSVEKIDHLMNSVGELVITQSMLSQFATEAEGPQAERLRTGLEQLERNVRELQESVMRVRMVPISFVFSRFPRMVRDLSQRLDKQVEIKMTGGETELDKTVLEKIGDPLVHLVRNCVDHGIEAPEVRQAAGKAPCGTVHLHAYHRGSNIQVEVSDDGGGLKKDRILVKARERGLLGPNDAPSDEEVYALIFLAGFSTADQATDISGRGVGMDVVRRNVEDLGGSIEVRSEPGRGSRFTITLPLTLAIVDGQTVAVGDETYIVPLTTIVESLQMSTASINRLGNRGELLAFRGDYLPVVRLQELFASPRRESVPEGGGLVMVVEGDGRRVGLCVDELLGQQQVVVKTLEENYGHVDGVAGATILGDGAVALILDVAGLARSATARAAA